MLNLHGDMELMLAVIDLTSQYSGHDVTGALAFIGIATKESGHDETRQVEVINLTTEIEDTWLEWYTGQSIS
jgi:hypothetical protein